MQAFPSRTLVTASSDTPEFVPRFVAGTAWEGGMTISSPRPDFVARERGRLSVRTGGLGRPREPCAATRIFENAKRATEIPSVASETYAEAGKLNGQPSMKASRATIASSDNRRLSSGAGKLSR